jgi:hypothetical protein
LTNITLVCAKCRNKIVKMVPLANYPLWVCFYLRLVKSIPVHFDPGKTGLDLRVKNAQLAGSAHWLKLGNYSYRVSTSSGERSALEQKLAACARPNWTAQELDQTGRDQIKGLTRSAFFSY